MKIVVRNIGPIREADIRLAPLTIFIGPNNSGKSIAAAMLYATLAPSQDQAIDTPHVNDHLRQEIRRFMEKLNQSTISIDQTPGTIVDFAEEGIRSTVHNYLNEILREIKRIGPPKSPALRRNSKHLNPGTLGVSCEDPGWSMTFLLEPGTYHGTIIDLPDIEELWDYFLSEVRISKERLNPDWSWFSLMLLSRLFMDFPRETWYLPAARSGILQSHKALAGSVIRSGRSDSLAFPVADFLGTLVEISPDWEGSFPEEADRIEREILHGTVKLKGEPFPEVVFQDAGGEYPPSRTSSMVSELAPVVLYLRHSVHMDDLLIIEEPEAHLHPATQIAFARALVRLVNQGLKVCLTTHSEFFLQQINNAIMASALTEDHPDEAGVSAERLDGNQVAAYFFEPTSDGTVVQQLPIDPKEGIPEVSFDAVTEQLYNEAIALDRSISGDE